MSGLVGNYNIPMTICFILVNPAVPGNIGAAARAMKTMGFGRMRLVNPCDHLGLDARKLAHGSNEVLETAEIFPSLAEALYDIDFVIGTTARRRSLRSLYTQVEYLPELIRGKGNSVKNIGVVFGSEESGLSNEDTKLCHLLSTVSMASKYPSLNLSQAVMIYAYNLSVLNGKKSRKPAGKQNPESWEVLKDKTLQILDLLDFPPGDPGRNQLMERLALLGEKDVFLLHSLVGRLLNNIK